MFILPPNGFWDHIESECHHGDWTIVGLCAKGVIDGPGVHVGCLTLNLSLPDSRATSIANTRLFKQFIWIKLIKIIISFEFCNEVDSQNLKVVYLNSLFMINDLWRLKLIYILYKIYSTKIDLFL